jgi:hypothetical protein
MDRLEAFGLFAVAVMVVCYALEDRSPRFILAFAASRVLASIYMASFTEPGRSVLWRQSGL